MLPYFFTFLLFLLLRAVHSDSDSISEIRCPEVKAQTPFPAKPTKVSMGIDYKIVLRFTDWLSNRTGKFSEKDFNGSKLVDRWDRTGHLSNIDRHIQFSEGWHHGNGSCSAFNSTEDPSTGNIYNLPKPVLQTFRVDGSSFPPLVDSLITYTGYNVSQVLDDTEGRRVAEIDTLEWLACQENIGKVGNESVNLQIIIEMAGDKSQQQPYDPHFANPHVYGVHIFLYKGLSKNITTVINHMSFEIVEHEKSGNDRAEFALTPPRGIYCDKISHVRQLPFEFPKTFEARADFKVIDKQKNHRTTYYDNFRLAYNDASKLIAYEFDFSNESRYNPFYAPIRFNGRLRIIHDFNYGLEYVINADDEEQMFCNKVQPIQKIFGDVTLDKNQTFHPNPASKVILLGLEPTDFYYSGKIDNPEAPLDIYVARTEKAQSKDAPNNETIVEQMFWSQNIHRASTSRLHSIIYNFENINSTHAKHVSFQFMTMSNITSSDMFDISPCLSNAEELVKAQINIANLDGQFYDYPQALYLPLSETTEIQKFPRSLVLSSLKFALSQASNISVLRLIQAELKELQGRVFAYFTIASRSGVEHPAPVFGLKEEITVRSAVAALNATVTSQRGFSFDVFNREGTQKITVISTGPLGTLAPEPAPWPPTPPKPIHVGYSLSSLVILSLFSFAFGISLVLGSMIFYQKRQRLRQMAYQVFE